ncbi:MAG: hypothetical protein DDT21_00669 [Syntrophomonadaceae bacterium]|nr:hypothetical protein [Bacillota bacterium]
MKKRDAKTNQNDSEQIQEEKPQGQEPVTLEVKKGRRIMRMEFASEADRAGWERTYRKSRWYTFYFLVGVGINFLMYLAGLDLDRQLFWGALVGITVPLLSMFLLTELHFWLLDRRHKKP